jgi:hypothetical protein
MNTSKRNKNNKIIAIKFEIMWPIRKKSSVKQILFYFSNHSKKTECMLLTLNFFKKGVTRQQYSTHKKM